MNMNNVNEKYASISWKLLNRFSTGSNLRNKVDT